MFCRGASPWDLTTSTAATSANGSIEVVRGDISSGQDVDQAAAGVDEIYHLAGVVSRDPRKKWTLYRIHLDGTRNICQAARTHGVKKVVAVSSSGTIATGWDPRPHNEHSGYKYEVVAEWPYYLSKIYAEKIALDFFRRHQLPVVVVNPSLLLGPGDDRSSSTGDVVLLMNGQITAVPTGGLNFVDVRDAATGIIAAMRSGQPGERYLLGGPNWTFQEFIQQLSEIAGVRTPKLRLPLGVSLASAAILREVMPWLGKSFPLDDATIKMSALFWYCDCSKASLELGFKTRDPIQTLRDTVADLRTRKAVLTASADV